MANLKFGKLPPRTDPRTPHLCNHLLPEHLVVPTHQDWIAAGRVGYWGVMLNDTIGDCVIAAKGHLIIEYTTLAGTHRNVILSDAVILKGYEDVGGYVPGQPNTDQGCDMLSAAQFYQTTGFGGHKISAYASIHPTDIQTLKAAINLFGAVDIGFNVPQSAMDQFYAGKPWDVVTNDGGIVGGHDVPLMAYDSRTRMYKCITWGQVQPMTEAFFNKYCDEVLTYLSPDWIYNGVAPNRFNLAQLAADIALINHAAHKSVNWPSIWAWIQFIAKLMGPAAIPVIEALANRLPLNPEELKIIDILIEQLLSGK